LPTSPMQFGYIYQMFYYGADGVMMTGIKPWYYETLITRSLFLFARTICPFCVR
jgi:hypothetical protein